MPVSTQPRPRMMPAEYLEAERRAEYKSEYYAGEVFAMTGASRQHNLIVTNLIVSLGTQLRESPCQVYPSDMRVKVQSTGLYTYPDVAVVCGDPEFEDEQVDTLLNPTALIEVLSPSTEAYDRGRKAEHYRGLESLQVYLLVAQDEPRVERYLRQGPREWLLTEFRGLSETVELSSVGCTLPLSQVYEKVLAAE
ncbi:MAG: Uma2 family endonuclease [Gemmatimonadetes bacterium]|nr:Uma2 family endonuclease [Gemmatimonadota bacterium]